MKKHPFLLLASIAFLVFAFCACTTKKSKAYLHEDDVKYAADICFQPIIQELNDLYALRKPEASMLPIFCNEDSVIRLFLRDSLRLAITTRPLTPKEKTLVTVTNKLNVLESRIAYDAFALIVHKECADTAINLKEIKDIISGKITRWEQLEANNGKRGELSLLFDASGSSTLRFMKDSLNNGKDLSGNIFAQGSNRAVIETVQKNKNVIGVVSTDWLRIASGDSTTLNSFRNLPIRVMHVGKIGQAKQDWVRPLQYYIATGEYPLIRSVYVLTSDPRVRSTLKSFYFFLKEDAAQRVISNSSQLLTKNPVQIRPVQVNR